MSLRHNRLETVPDEVFERILTYQPKMYARILEVMSALEVKGGNIVLNKDNILLLENLFGDLRQAVLSEDYLAIIKGYASEFDKQGVIIDEFFLKEFEANVSNDSLLILSQSKRNAVALMVGDGLDYNVIKPVSDILRDAVYNGAAWSDTVADVQAYALGNEQVDSRLMRYSKQVVSDAFAIADRSYSMSNSKRLGLVWYRYLGGLIKDSRCFCEARNRGYFHEE